MSTNTRDRLRQQAKLRAAFMTLHPSAAWHLFPPLHATALMQFDYDLLAEQCQCKTRSHRRKACVLNGQGRCRSCGAYTPDNDSYPLQCPGCHDWEDTRMRYLGQWAMDHDDRNQLPDTVFQASLFASDQPFQFEQVPQPRWPFNWSRGPLEHIGPEGACFMCGNTDAPGSYEWDTPGKPHPCTGRARHANISPITTPASTRVRSTR